jgi:hypothetical protein
MPPRLRFLAVKPKSDALSASASGGASAVLSLFLRASKKPRAERYGFVSARPASSAYRRANFASLARRGLLCSSSANTRSSAA